MSDSKKTTDHDEIQKWAEARDGKPMKVKETDSGDGEGMIRLAFPNHSQNDDKLEKIGWSEFFAIFESNKLAMIYDADKGKDNNFHKLVSRN